MKLANICLLGLALLLTTGCGTTPTDYIDTSPEFDLKEFFSGDLKGWGLVTNYRGKVARRFTVDLEGRWSGNNGELYELFSYQDGTTQERTWILEKKANGINIGTAGDVIGDAVGEQQGFAFYWKYNLLIDLEDKQVKVHLQDWIYQIDQNSVISKAKIKKFGIPVGEVIVFILKEEQAT